MTTEPATELPLARGALVISIDLELAWGTWDHQSDEGHRFCAIHERAVVRRLLALFERYEVPVTWAIVGRLLDLGDARTRRGGVQNWYAPEVVEWVREARPGHEIGSHGYAHVYFDRLTRAEAEVDLDAVARVHAREGLELRSLVFPRNLVGHLDLVKRAGIKVFRNLDQGFFHEVGRRGQAVPGLRAAANLADKLLGASPEVVRPRELSPGLVALDSSLLLIGRNGLRRAVRPDRFAAKMRAGLRRATERASIFHLWFHPSNFYFDAEAQYELIEGLLREATRSRARSELEIRTMGSFAP